MPSTRRVLCTTAFVLATMGGLAKDTPIKAREFLSKGGVGIISSHVYVVTTSSKNEIVLPDGKRWVGLPLLTPQVVYVMDGIAIENPSSEKAFDLSRIVVISFQKDRIYFYDFSGSSGGYYSRIPQ